MLFFAELGGGGAEDALAVATEVAERGEVHPVGDIAER